MFVLGPTNKEICKGILIQEPLEGGDVSVTNMKFGMMNQLLEELKKNAKDMS